jgi:hypothetical protein
MTLIATLIVSLLLACDAVQADRQPAELRRALERFHAGATIVASEDMDGTACAPLGESPGLVAADLNGDGRQDYGVLLRLKYTGKETRWQGTLLREAQFSFVIFIGQGDGEFRTRVVRRYTDDIPTSVTIGLREPGVIRHRITGKDIRLARPGIMMSFCEKSATIYYLDGDKLRSIPFSD